MQRPSAVLRGRSLALLACCATLPAAQGAEGPRLSDAVLPPQVELVPERPRPLLELGDPFFGPGPLREGIELPGGAVWQPSFLVYGTLRTAAQTFDDGNDALSEVATRLDLFGNLQLTGTERVLVGLRPLDTNGRFTSYVLDARTGGDEGWQEHTDLKLESLFFEGELGELFPGLDAGDRHALDLGFSVGRQPILLQDGLLVDDVIDAVGVTRNALRPPGFSNLRVTALFGWDNVHRDDNRENEDALFWALSAEGDLGESTVSLDGVYVDDTDGESDAFYFGAGGVQRVGRTNTALRAIASLPVHEETPQAGRGVLVFTELSCNVGASDDLVYLDAFLGLGEPSSAARARDRAGPLGRTGLLFAAVGLGRYGAALGNRADDAFGAALGWQGFLGDPDHRRQLVLEVGGRESTEDPDLGAVALGTRFEQAFGRHLALRLDGFVAGRESEAPSTGARLELAWRF